MSKQHKPRTEDMMQRPKLRLKDCLIDPWRLLERLTANAAHELHRDVLRQLSDDETVESTIEESGRLPEAREETSK